jgi:hypothetical protein
MENSPYNVQVPSEPEPGSKRKFDSESESFPQQQMQQFRSSVAATGPDGNLSQATLTLPEPPVAQVQSKKVKALGSRKPQAPEHSFFRKTKTRVVVCPSVKGILHLIDMTAKSWKYQMKKGINIEAARSVLLRLFRETAERYLSELYQKEYPDYGYHSDCTQSELPLVLAYVIGRLGPSHVDNDASVVLDVHNFLRLFDHEVRLLGWDVATWEDLDAVLVPLRQSVEQRNAQWSIPLKGASLLRSGVCIEGVGEHEKVFPVCKDSTSRRTELMAGLLKFREFGRVNDYMWPALHDRELSAGAALSTYLCSTEAWTEENFRRELFGPVMYGEKVLSA